MDYWSDYLELLHSWVSYAFVQWYFVSGAQALKKG